MDLETEPAGFTAGRGFAVGAGVLAAALAITAHLGRLAESPVVGQLPALGAFGPGAMGRLRAATLDEKGRPPANIASLGRDALAVAPLSYEPFFAVAAAGFRTQTQSGSDRDAALLREALQRNPRSREAKVFLLRYDVSHNRLAEAIDQIAGLQRLNGIATSDLLVRVGAAVRTEKQVDEAAAALAPHPELFEPFLRGFASLPKPAALSIRLVSQIPRAALADPGVKAAAMRELVGAQAFAEARRIWATAAPSSELLHSPNFSDRTSPAPFNWDLAANSTGVAEYAQGGVSVDYFGREPGPLLSQLLTLQPGNYTATLAYRTTAGSPGALGLRLACAGQPIPLFEQPLSGRTGANQILKVSFAIPQQGCGGQFVSIGGRVQESRDPQQALVSRLEITNGAAR